MKEVYLSWSYTAFSSSFPPFFSCTIRPEAQFCWWYWWKTETSPQGERSWPWSQWQTWGRWGEREDGQQETEQWWRKDTEGQTSSQQWPTATETLLQGKRQGEMVFLSKAHHQVLPHFGGYHQFRDRANLWCVCVCSLSDCRTMSLVEEARRDNPLGAEVVGHAPSGSVEVVVVASGRESTKGEVAVTRGNWWTYSNWCPLWYTYFIAHCAGFRVLRKTRWGEGGKSRNMGLPYLCLLLFRRGSKGCTICVT